MTPELAALFEAGRRVARRLGHARLEPEHVLAGALEPPSVRTAAALHAAGIDVGVLRDTLIGGVVQPSSDSAALEPETGPALQHYLGGNAPGARGGPPEQVLADLLGASELSSRLRAEALDVDSLCRLLAAPPERSALGEDCPALTRYAWSVSESARRGELDPVLGRDQELAQLVQILTRRLKNNPLIIGEPGVGKTALVEGLAQRMLAQQVPEYIADHSVMSLDLGLLLAGTRYRGEFEERLKNVLAEIARVKKVILFIDEIHMLVGAGAAAGGADAANLLKPALARGELKCIGATTAREYRASIEKDQALSRRFQALVVAEPSAEQALAMLRGLRPALEKHHAIRISDAALRAAVALSKRYITDRALPDKAIDVLDQAAALLRTELASRPAELERLAQRLAQLELELRPAADASAELSVVRAELRAKSAEWLQRRAARAELSALRQRREQARGALEAAVKERHFARVASLEHQQIPALEAELDALCARLGAAGAAEPEVSEAAVAQVVSRITGVPTEKLAEEEARRLARLEQILGQRVVGQAEAVAHVSRAVRRARANLRDPNRPIASFLLVGPTGVGKTELCKALAEFLFGDPSALVRLDMSEFQEKHSVARLIGAPPGYVGFDQGGELTNRVRRKAYSVVLFDEVEKAHPDVFNLLLQVLDEGHLMDSSGVRVDFKNTILMLTSNLGSAPGPDAGNLAERCLAAVKAHFRPELLNRLDDTIVFQPLDIDALVPIVQGHLVRLRQRLKEQHIQLDWAEGACAAAARRGYDAEYGARPLARFIRDVVQDPIAERIVDGTLAEGGTVFLTEELGCEVNAPARPSAPAPLASS